MILSKVTCAAIFVAMLSSVEAFEALCLFEKNLKSGYSAALKAEHLVDSGNPESTPLKNAAGNPSCVKLLTKEALGELHASVGIAPLLEYIFAAGNGEHLNIKAIFDDVTSAFVTKAKNALKPDKLTLDQLLEVPIEHVKSTTGGANGFFAKVSDEYIRKYVARETVLTDVNIVTAKAVLKAMDEETFHTVFTGDMCGEIDIDDAGFTDHLPIAVRRVIGADCASKMKNGDRDFSAQIPYVQPAFVGKFPSLANSVIKALPKRFLDILSDEFCTNNADAIAEHANPIFFGALKPSCLRSISMTISSANLIQPKLPFVDSKNIIAAIEGIPADAPVEATTNLVPKFQDNEEVLKKFIEIAVKAPERWGPVVEVNANHNRQFPAGQVTPTLFKAMREGYQEILLAKYGNTVQDKIFSEITGEVKHDVLLAAVDSAPALLKLLTLESCSRINFGDVKNKGKLKTVGQLLTPECLKEVSGLISAITLTTIGDYPKAVSAAVADLVAMVADANVETMKTIRTEDWAVLSNGKVCAAITLEQWDAIPMNVREKSTADCINALRFLGTVTNANLPEIFFKYATAETLSKLVIGFKFLVQKHVVALDTNIAGVRDIFVAAERYIQNISVKALPHIPASEFAKLPNLNKLSNGQVKVVTPEQAAQLTPQALVGASQQVNLLTPKAKEVAQKILTPAPKIVAPAPNLAVPEAAAPPRKA